MVKDLIRDQLKITEDIQFDRVHRLRNDTKSSIIARFTNFKDKQRVLRQKQKLSETMEGSTICIREDFSRGIWDIRRRLVPFLKPAKAAPNNTARMVYDHLVINGKWFYYDPVSNDIKETVMETKTVSECTTDFDGLHKCESNTGDHHKDDRKALAKCNSTDFGALDAENLPDSHNTACVTCEYDRSENVYTEDVSGNTSFSLSDSMRRGASVLNGVINEQVCVDGVSPVSHFFFVTWNVNGL